MPAMRRLAAVTFFVLLASSCGGESAPVPSPSRTNQPTATPPGPSLTGTVATPTPPTSPTIEVPVDAPTTYGRRLTSDKVPVADLVPLGAEVTTAWRLPPTTDQVPQIALAWTRGVDPFSAEHGFEVWQQFPDKPPWRVVYAFTDPPSEGVLGVRFDVGDVTGDAIPDVLTFEDKGGSGGCGDWRVVQSGAGFATAILRRSTCDTQIEIASGRLRIRAAEYEPGDSHCCPSRFRTTTIRWDGKAWTVVDRVVTSA
jgi:hypothetical protein